MSADEKRTSPEDWSEQIAFASDFDELERKIRAAGFDIEAIASAQRKPGAVRNARVLPQELTGEDPGGLVEETDDRYVEIELTGHRITYCVRAGITDDGPHLIAMTMRASSGDPITPADLRRIPVKRLAAIAARIHVNRRDDQSSTGLPDLPPEQLVSSPEREQARRPGRPGRTDDELKRVAELAAEAHDERVAMHEYVAAKLNIAPSTAKRAISQATARGFRQKTRPSPTSRSEED